MKELAIKIQQVMDTIQQFEMKPTYDNCNHMLGCLQTLADVRNALVEKDKESSEQNAPVIPLKMNEGEEK